MISSRNMLAVEIQHCWKFMTNMRFLLKEHICFCKISKVLRRASGHCHWSISQLSPVSRSRPCSASCPATSRVTTRWRPLRQSVTRLTFSRDVCGDSEHAGPVSSPATLCRHQSSVRPRQNSVLTSSVVVPRGPDCRFSQQIRRHLAFFLSLLLCSDAGPVAVWSPRWVAICSAWSLTGRVQWCRARTVAGASHWSHCHIESEC